MGEAMREENDGGLRTSKKFEGPIDFGEINGAYRTYPGWVLWIGIGIAWVGIIGVVILSLY
jgi:hypothetical protein